MKSVVILITITILLSKASASIPDQCGLRGLCSRVDPFHFPSWYCVYRNYFLITFLNRKDGFKLYLQSLLTHVLLFVKELLNVYGIPIVKIIK